jgi:hypothetical protein
MPRQDSADRHDFAGSIFCVPLQLRNSIPAFLGAMPREFAVTMRRRTKASGAHCRSWAKATKPLHT